MKEVTPEDLEFCVLGIQRSGTNYLSAMIKRNIKAKIYHERNTWKQTRGVWKHCMELEDKRDFNDFQRTYEETGNYGGALRLSYLKNDINVAYIHKHPYSWIESIIYNNVDIKRTFPDLVVSKNTKEDHVFEQLDLAKLVDHWIRHVTYWYDKRKEYNIYCVSYENLISNTEYHIRNIAKKWNKECVSDKGFSQVEKVGQSVLFNDGLRDKYKQVNISLLGYHHIEYINNKLPQKLIKDLGYSMIEDTITWQNRKIKPYK